MIEIIQFEQQRQNRLKEKNWTETCRTITEVLPFTSSETQKERERAGIKKLLEEITIEIFLNLAK